jgi:anaerobic selenocysteine-containing dehydrogenase
MSDNIITEQDNKYWQDVENKVLDPKELRQEFKDDEFDSFSVTKSRRNFLKIMGFTVTAMPLSGCIKIPVRKAIPYLNKSENQIPGVANYYATTFNNTPIVVKTREGRPIYVKGNKLSKNTQGAINAPAIASVLSLYDSNRLRSPMVNGNAVEWETFDKTFKKMFGKAIESGKDVYLITPTVKSPSQIAIIDKLNAKYGVKHIAFDAYSECSIHQANQLITGSNVTNETDFSNADLILSFDADFLGTWGDDVKNTKEYSSRRNPDGDMSKHIQVEALMSLSGTNADIRHTQSMKSQRKIIKAMVEILSSRELTVKGDELKLAQSLVKELKSKKSSLVISGDSLISTQIMISKINYLLGNYGKTINVVESKYAKYSNNIELEKAFEATGSGNVSGMIFWDVNPAHTFYDKDKALNAIKSVDFSVSFASSEDETSKLCSLVAPNNHVFESWNDNYNGYNELSLTQPVIQPLFGSRMAEETLMVLLNEERSYYEFIRDSWKANIYPLASGFTNFDEFWNKSLHDGVINLSGLSKVVSLSNSKLTRDTKAALKVANEREASEGLVLNFYQKYAIRDGSQGNNPWLHELPDPVTKATWDNYIMIAKSLADEKSIKSGDVVEVKTDSGSLKLPAIVQPGTDKNTLGIAVGYGRNVAGKVALGLGANAFQHGRLIEGTHSYHDTKVVSLTKTGAHRGLAQTQTHHSMEGRDIVRETTLDSY